MSICVAAEGAAAARSATNSGVADAAAAAAPDVGVGGATAVVAVVAGSTSCEEDTDIVTR